MGGKKKSLRLKDVNSRGGDSINVNARLLRDRSWRPVEEVKGGAAAAAALAQKKRDEAAAASAAGGGGGKRKEGVMRLRASVWGEAENRRESRPYRGNSGP